MHGLKLIYLRHNMEEILKLATSQVPSLVVLVIVVIVFLRALEKRDIIYIDAFDKRDKEMMEARMHSRDVILKNTEVVAQSIIVSQNMTETMKEFIHTMNIKHK